MFCSPDEGAAAAVLCRADQADRYTSTPDLPEGGRGPDPAPRRLRGPLPVGSPRGGRSPTVHASKAAYELAGIGPDDVDVIQLQDTDAGAEVIHMARERFLRGRRPGEVSSPIGRTDIDGPLPINTDGGLIANGEPIGASGLRQVHEVVLQLRGLAGDRQVPGNPRVGFAQLYGAPGTPASPSCRPRPARPRRPLRRPGRFRRRRPPARPARPTRAAASMANDGVVDAGVQVAELGEARRHGRHREVAGLDGVDLVPRIGRRHRRASGTPRTE